MTKVTWDARSDLGHVSVPQRRGGSRPHQRVGSQPSSSLRRLCFASEESSCVFLVNVKNIFTISPGGIVLLSLRDCHVDVSIGSAVTEPHAHCRGQGHSQQPDEENLQEKTIIDLQLIAITVWTDEQLSLAISTMKLLKLLRKFSGKQKRSPSQTPNILSTCELTSSQS